MSKKKYKGYYYTLKKNADGMYVWRIRNKKGEILEISNDCFPKNEAEINAQETIDEYYY